MAPGAEKSCGRDWLLPSGRELGASLEKGAIAVLRAGFRGIGFCGGLDAYC